MKLAEALVLRKHLEAKVEQLKPLKLQGDKGLFEVQTNRKSVSENVDEITTQVPKITLKDVTEEYDRYSKALRQLDTAIQQTNWQAELQGEVSLEGVNV
jgi:hypothetical protein